MVENKAPNHLLSEVLDAVEDASPLEAVEAVTQTLARALGASAAFFLVADVAGGALVRMSHGASDETLGWQGLGGLEGPTRLEDGEQAVAVPIDGGPVEMALRTQTAQVLAPAGSGTGRQRNEWVVLAPVTERGEVLGLLQLSLPKAPDASALAQVTRIAHVLAFVVIANRRHTDLFERAQRGSPSPCLPRSSGACFRPRSRARRGPSPWRGGWNRRPRWRGHVRLLPGPQRPAPVADGRHGSRRGERAHSHAVRGEPAQHSPEGGSLMEQADVANQVLFEHAAANGADEFATGMLGRLDLSTGTWHGQCRARRAISLA